MNALAMNSDGVFEFNWSQTTQRARCEYCFLEKLKDRQIVCVCSTKIWARAYFKACNIPVLNHR